MRPTGNNIIIKADLEQKETLVYGTLKLFVPFKDKYNTDGKVGNPVLAEVVEANDKFGEIKKGDAILLGHNILLNPAFELFTEDNVRTLAIPCDKWILGKLGAAGEVIPLFGNIVAKRIDQAPVSSIIIVPDSYKKAEGNKVVVLAVSKEAKDIQVSQIAIVFTHADYEAVYNVNGEERRTVIVCEEDILATN